MGLYDYKGRWTVRYIMDTVPTRSLKKHRRYQARRGIEIDGVVDVHYYDSLDLSRSINKQLRKRDVAVSKFWILKRADIVS